MGRAIGSGQAAKPNLHHAPVVSRACNLAPGLGDFANVSARAAPEEAGENAGFTLVEMLVTLVILGLAAAVATQFAGSGTGRRADRIAATLGAEMALLRVQALRSGETAHLVFEPDSGRFLSSRPGAVPIATAPLPVVVQVEEAATATPGEIRFLPDGGSSGGRIVIGGRVLTVGMLLGRVTRGTLP